MLKNMAKKAVSPHDGYRMAGCTPPDACHEKEKEFTFLVEHVETVHGIDIVLESEKTSSNPFKSDFEREMHYMFLYAMLEHHRFSKF